MVSLSRWSFVTLCLMFVAIISAVYDPVNATPVNSKAEQEGERDDERRATWLETRNLENNFKQLVLLSLQELASEGVVDPRVLTADRTTDKRGRHQGFCFRKTKSGRFVPYICWKGEGDNDEK